jgi:hypothetical protein
MPALAEEWALTHARLVNMPIKMNLTGRKNKSENHRLWIQLNQYWINGLKELTTTTVDAALPLEAIPGTAQVDFGTAPIKYQSEVIDCLIWLCPFLIVIPFIFKFSLRKTQNVY